MLVNRKCLDLCLILEKYLKAKFLSTKIFIYITAESCNKTFAKFEVSQTITVS